MELTGSNEPTNSLNVLTSESTPNATTGPEVKCLIWA